jgi:N-acetylglucosamine kinase-like BadF-type ATPase
MVDLVVGVDVGGTSTRCLVVSASGALIGSGTAGGGSIRSSAGLPSEQLAAALRAALTDVSPDSVRAGAFGIAGSGTAAGSLARDAAVLAWKTVGLTGTPRVVTDLEVAFAAGTSAASGLLLLAGTGAAAVAFADRAVTRRCDGYGWLLGDEGSAVWLGLRGVQAALNAYDGRGPATSVRDAVAEHFGLHDDFAQGVIAAVHAREPAYLGRLAPLVTAAADAGDPVAAELVEAGAARLVAAVRAVWDGNPADLVLAGGLLLAGGPVRRAVLARLDGLPLRHRDAGPGAAGAAVLALGDLGGGALDPGIHERVLRAGTES